MFGFVRVVGCRIHVERNHLKAKVYDKPSAKNNLFLMEVEHPFVSIFVTFILLTVFMLLRRGKLSKTPQKKLNLPPGPWTLPLIGNLHQLVGYISLPHHGLRDLAKKYGPLMHLQAGEISTIVVSSPDAAKDVMQTRGGIFATRGHYQAADIVSYDCTSIFFAPYGDYWRQLKKMFVSEILSKKRVQFIQSIREEDMSNLINWIASKAGSPVNLTDNLHSSSYNITSKAAFGRKSKNQVILMSLMKRVMILATRADIADMFPSSKFLQCISVVRCQLERLHQEVDQILENIINEHKDKARSEFGKREVDDEDLVDILLKVQEHDDSEFHLTIDNIKSVIIDVFFGSSDTSATIVDWAMSELMKNPRLMKKAQAEVRGVVGNRKGDKVDQTGINEMKFLKLVIKETMRLHPPATLIPRECGEQCVINGFDIPIKAKIIVNIWAIGRDPEYWTEPESFVPERFLDCPIGYKARSKTNNREKSQHTTKANPSSRKQKTEQNTTKRGSQKQRTTQRTKEKNKKKARAHKQDQKTIQDNMSPPDAAPFLARLSAKELEALEQNTTDWQTQHRLRDLANKYGPLMYLQLGEVPIIVISSAEIAEEVLKTHGIISASRPFLVSTKVALIL
ncbi:hypothetical protein Dsin_023363 [Dipteronia sinensis]|uniref:Cytochrome P450 n=1 Tax=Dipteronia sinensis TaxID=43782 RepID=A0AAE0A346_9ROSI|nr:hypothetical protein Dsin_023363 [Dipteronia sinensis]